MQHQRDMYFDNYLAGEPGFQLRILRELTKEEVEKLEAAFPADQLYIEQEYHDGMWGASWIDGDDKVKDEVTKILEKDFGLREYL